MGERERRARWSSQGGSSASRSGPLRAGVIGLAMVVGLSLGLFLAKGSTDSSAAQFRGGPRLAVDTDLVDFGVVPFNQPVRASFRIRNVGDQPLRLPASPPLEVVEGC